MLFPAEYAVPVDQIERPSRFSPVYQWNPSTNSEYLKPFTGGRLFIRNVSLSMDKWGENNDAYNSILKVPGDVHESGDFYAVVFQKHAGWIALNQRYHDLLEYNQGLKWYHTEAGGDTVVLSATVHYQKVYDD